MSDFKHISEILANKVESSRRRDNVPFSAHVTVSEAVEAFGEDCVPVLKEKQASLQKKIELKELVLGGYKDLNAMSFKIFAEEHDLPLNDRELVKPLFDSVKDPSGKDALRVEKELEGLQKELKRIRFALRTATDRASGKKTKELDVESAKRFPIENLYTGDLSKNGAHLKGICPFHKDTDPSFLIDTRDNHFHCFGCGKQGDSINFLMELEGLSFVEAVRRLE